MVSPADVSLLPLLALLRHGATVRYAGEAVSQLEHALQTAALARQAGAGAELISAALLHDAGHLLAPATEADDRHEQLGAAWLGSRFGPAVTEPVRLHVAAKRYLVAASATYAQRLSADSLRSLVLQGGPMSAAEQAAFMQQAHASDALRLRAWDDLAKLPDAPAQHLDAYRPFIAEAMALAQRA